MPGTGVSRAVISVTVSGVRLPGQRDGGVLSSSLCGAAQFWPRMGVERVRLSPMCSGDHGGGRVDGPAAITGCGHRSLETLGGLQRGKRPSPRGRLVTEESAAPARRVLGPNQAPSPPPGRPALQVGPALPDPCGSGRSGLVGAERWMPQVESGLGGTGAWRRPRLCGRGFLLRGGRCSVTGLSGLAPLWPISLASASGHTRPRTFTQASGQRWIASSGSEAGLGRAQPLQALGLPARRGPESV